MALERRDPVPPGRYYVFVDEDSSDEWSEWASEHKGAVRVIAVEPQTVSPSSPVWATTPKGDIIVEYAGDWILFDVLSPVPWVNIGLPTIVTDMRVRSTRDVYALPPPESDMGPLDELEASVKLLVTLATIGGVVVIGNTVLQGMKLGKRLGGAS